MNESPPVVCSDAPKDRRGGLIGLGIVVLALGCLCALFIPLMYFGQAMAAKSAGTAPDYRLIVPGAITYGLLAVVFVWLGIGSILARRWARALLLIIAWVWLVFGVVGLTIMIVILPRIFAAAGPDTQAGVAAMRAVIMAVTVGFMAVFGVVLPAVFVLFYRSPHVKATCERLDPVPGWTDACPLPVLGLSLLLAFGAVSMLPLLVVYHSVVPWFGILLSGSTGAGVVLAMVVVWGWSAWSIYHLRIAGWWLILVALAVFTLSSMLTFARVDLLEMYRQMGYPEQQIAQIKQFNFLTNRHLVIWMSLGWLPFLGYLLSIRKYFPKPA